MNWGWSRKTDPITPIDSLGEEVERLERRVNEVGAVIEAHIRNFNQATTTLKRTITAAEQAKKELDNSVNLARATAKRGPTQRPHY